MKWSCDLFWSRRPALLYGLCGALSFSAFLNSSPVLFALLCVIAASSASGWHRLLGRVFLIGGISASAALLAFSSFQFPDLPLEGAAGKAVFSIDRLSSAQNNFGAQWNYRGTIKKFYAADQRYCGKNMPCSVFIPAGKQLKRPVADKDYVVKGRLLRGKSGNYFLSLDKEEPWMPMEGTSSRAEWRYMVKNKVKGFLRSQIPDDRTLEFLSGIFTGEFEDRVMRVEFGRLGLQHLLAISGFHFALLTGIAAFFLRLIFPQKVMIGLLLLFVLSYFYFLGSSPSILRAWMMTFVAFTGMFSERRSQPLNALGAALLVVLVYDPLVLQTVGFQFSALVTASILIFYPAARTALENVIPKRSIAEMKAMCRFDQHCYCLLSLLREGLALALAVNITAIPLSLFYFGKFPVLSLLYNLFIPFLVGFSMFLVVLASLSIFIAPFLGTILFKAAGAYTHFVLNFIYNTPYSLNIYWRVEGISFVYLLAFFSALLLSGIIISNKNAFVQNNNFDTRMW